MFDSPDPMILGRVVFGIVSPLAGEEAVDGYVADGNRNQRNIISFYALPQLFHQDDSLRVGDLSPVSQRLTVQCNVHPSCPAVLRIPHW
jgi:hypothetical protein